MKVKIPREIKVCGVYPYKINYNPHIRDDEGYAGFINFRTEEITILPHLASRAKDEDLLHELIHAFENAYHFSITEEVNHRIAEGFLDFMLNSLGIEFDWSDIR